MEVVSKRNRKLLAIVIFEVSMMIIPATIMTVFEPYLFLFAIWMYLLASAVLFLYLGASPAIKMTQQELVYKGKKYDWAEVAKVILSGTKRSLFIFPIPVTTISLKSGKYLFIRQTVYSNSTQLKQFLSDKMNRGFPPSNAAPFIDSSVTQAALNSEDYRVFMPDKTSPFVVWQYAFPFAILYILSTGTISISRIIIAICLLWFSLLLWRRMYFAVSRNYLVVKMKYSPFWKDKPFVIANIEEARFERFSETYRINILTRDMEEKTFSLELFSRERVIELMQQLENLEVNVTSQVI